VHQKQNAFFASNPKGFQAARKLTYSAVKFTVAKTGMVVNEGGLGVAFRIGLQPVMRNIKSCIKWDQVSQRWQGGHKAVSFLRLVEASLDQASVRQCSSKRGIVDR
jgi:hypothetical protein